MSQLSLFTRPTPTGRTNLVIEAGAGTGKTTAIVREVVMLLLENPTLEPERVVLITFTEKAAGEIADRIRDAMTELHLSFDSGRPSWPADSEDPIITIPPEKIDAYRAACEGHLQRIDRLRSQTIHAFCQSILRMFPIEANLDPDFSIIQGYERTRLYDQIYDEWLDADTKSARAHRGEWEILYHHYHHLDFVRRAIFTLLPKRDVVADGRYSLGEIGDGDTFIREMILAIRVATPGEVAKFNEDGLAFLTHVREAALPTDASVEAWLAFFEPVSERLEKITLPSGGGKTPLKEAVKLLRGDRPGKRITDRLRQQTISVALRAVAARFFAALDAEKRRRAVVDFDDLLLRTQEVLGNRHVLRTLRARYEHIFVDEFQDTDRVQAEIIDKLARDDDERFVSGKMTIVGDPKQSIYSFRRADPECYAATVEMFVVGGARTHALRKQYRSDPPLVDGLNAIFGQLFAATTTCRQVYRPAYQELDAARTDLLRDLDARFTFLRASTSENGSREAGEARTIASWILQRAQGSGLGAQEPDFR
ncbi:MAG TPA: UvrD-helicase domain-containing protein, partial [Thermoanaerobaculia bacterium]